MNVTVIGLGYVGLINAVGLASIGHKVIGYDVNASKIKALNLGIPTLQEPGLADLLKASKSNIAFTGDPKGCFNNADIIMITVDTPENEDGSCNLTHISEALQTIVENADNGAVVIIKSTVPVGTNKKIQDIFDKKAPHKFSVVSNPEFLSQGRAVKDMLHPSRIIIGTTDPVAHMNTDLLYEYFCKNDVTIFYTSPESAELIKYASNNFLALKISFINELALLCDKTGADIQMVSRGIGLDPRIGSAFLQAGIGYGGSCFPKDTKTLNWMAIHKGEPLDTIQATIKINNKMPRIFVNRIAQRYDNDLKNITLAVLGLSFKGETNDTRNSQAYLVINLLLELGATIIGYDKNAESEFAERIGKIRKLKYAASIKDALKNVDGVIILNDAEEFKALKQNDFQTMMNKKPIIFDGRNLYNLEEMQDVEYYSIGRPRIHRYKEKGPYDN